MNTKRLILCLALSSTGLMAQVVDRPLWLRYPSISPDGKEIAFSYQGDIYKVSSGGGHAIRLTANPAFDSRPIWSPDGKEIAFTSDRNSLGTNIYTMDSGGGSVHQVTTHSTTETPYTYSPDGKYILFKAHIQDPVSSALFPTAMLSELYRIPRAGGRVEQVIASPAEFVQFSPDGKKLLFQNVKGQENEWRKHHTSSVTRDLLEYDLDRKTYRTVEERDGEDRNAVYSPDGKSIYFLSERNGGDFNVYQRGLDQTNGVTPLTNFRDEPVRFLSTSKDGLLCFSWAGEIYTLRPGGKPERIAIQLQAPEDTSEPINLTASNVAGSFDISPDGKQLAFISRGDLFVTTTDYITTKRITQTPGEERAVSFGSDNRSLIYDSRRGGLWDLYITRLNQSQDPNFPNATTLSEELLIPSLKGEKGYPQVSPDGKEVAFIYQRSKLMVYNLQTKQVREITDGSTSYGDMSSESFQWSPDGKWFTLTFDARAHAPYSDIGIVSAAGGQKIFNLTNSGYICGNPRWALDGNAIIYRTDRYGMRNHASWGSMNDEMIVFLNREAYDKYQMSEEEFELFTEGEKKAKTEANKATDSPSKKTDKTESKATPTKAKSKTIHIDWDNIEDRTVRLTPNSSALRDALISPDGKKLYFLTSFEGKTDLWSLDLRKGDPKIVRKGVGSASLLTDKDGKTLFVIGAQPMKMSFAGETFKSISAFGQMRIDRDKERAAMYEEVVREEAERFYVKDMHGVDWGKLTNIYRRYLPHISNNYDFAELLSELLGELNVSHTGGRYAAPSSSMPTAELGLFVSNPKQGDGLVVDEVVLGGPFDRFNSKLRAGDILTKIDGTPLMAGADYFELLNGKTGKPTLISYYSSSQGKEVSEVVRPISASTLRDLLYKRWVKQRAAEVERLSDGQLGYVHIPSMGDPSFRTMYSEALGRYYRCKGLIVDIRYNGGGRLHEDIEVFLTGKQYLEQVVRGKEYCEMPSRRWNHPSVMLTCEADYSNAHGTPWVYQKMRIGKVVGMPVPGTMTSVNWVTLQDPSLIYGIPAVGYRTAEGGYLENQQVEPDVKVKLDLSDALRGKDTQLEQAVRTLLDEVKTTKK